MKIKVRIRRSMAVGTTMVLMAAAAVAGWGQSSGSGRQNGVQTAPAGVPSILPPDAGVPPQMERDQARMRNNERQKQLVSDTDKLVALANELKADVEKSNKDTLSLDVVRKADEIEKLAHSVKEKMKGS